MNNSSELWLENIETLNNVPTSILSYPSPAYRITAFIICIIGISLIIYFGFKLAKGREDE